MWGPRWLLCAMVWGAGCSRTGLVLDVALDTGLAPPVSLRLSEPDLIPPLVRELALDGAEWPYRLGQDFDDDPASPFRVLIDGLDSSGKIVAQAGACLQIPHDAISEYTLTLAPGLHPLADCAGGGFDLGAGDSADGMSVPDMPPAVFCQPGYLVCDDFNSATLDTTRWFQTDKDPGNTIVLDGAHARGALALHATVPAGPGGEASVRANFGPISSGKLVLHFWIYAQDTPYQDSSSLLFLSKTGTGQGILFGSAHSPPKWYINPGPTAYVSTLTITPGWHCVELTNTLAGTMSNVVVTVDNAQAITASFASPVPSWDLIRAGIINTYGAVASEDWIDDLAISTTAIGCP